MKSEKGITLASLGIYIVVILIALITFSTITAYFRSNVNEFNTKTTVDLEFDKFNLYFIEEVKKTNNKIDEINSNETKISFSSGNTYEFRENSIILNGNVKIAEKIEACTFSFSASENNIQSVTVYIKVGETERTNQYTLSNQITDIQNTEDYIYGYKRVVGTSPLLMENSIATNLKDYKIYGNSIQDGTPSPSNPVEVQSVGDITKNLINPNDIQYISSYGGDVTSTKMVTSSKNKGIIIPCEPNTKYTLQRSQNTSIFRVFYYETEPVLNETISIGGGYFDSGTNVNKLAFSFTTKENAHWVGIALGTDEELKETKVWLTKGATTEYEPYGKYKIPVKTSGTNLIAYPYQNTTTTVNGITYTDNGDGTVTANGTATANAIFNIRTSTSSVWEGISPDKTYTASLSYEGNYGGKGVSLVVNYYPNGSSSYSGWLTCGPVNSKTGNAPSNIAGLRVYLLITSGTTVNNLTLKPQVQAGTEATEYEQYVEPTIANIFLDEPLRKVGDYADYIDFENQKVVRNIQEKILNGTEGLSTAEQSTSYNTENSTNRIVKIGSVDDAIMPKTSGTKKIGLVTHLYFTSVVWNSDNKIGYTTNNVNQFHLRFTNEVLGIEGTDDYTVRTTKFKEYLKQQYDNGTPIKLYYQLSTPAEELIELPNIQSKQGKTIFTVDTKVPPSNIETVYYSK